MHEMRRRRREAAGKLCLGSAEKETTRAIPRCITPSVPVVGVTGDHFGFVMLALFTLHFCSVNNWRGILCWRFFFHDRRWAPLYLHRNRPTDYRRTEMVTPVCYR